MCVTSPARVVEVNGETALIDLDGTTRRASLLLVPDVKAGDWVIVAAGTVLELLEEAEAREVMDLLSGAEALPEGERK